MIPTDLFGVAYRSTYKETLKNRSVDSRRKVGDRRRARIFFVWRFRTETALSRSAAFAKPIYRMNNMKYNLRCYEYVGDTLVLKVVECAKYF